ncbi:MAG: hypothetical protein IT385_13980 [Deltaproteobacteria bacterium]|nr:hypothetical protein [Deltaproteobacteria bacterium]
MVSIPVSASTSARPSQVTDAPPPPRTRLRDVPRPALVALLAWLALAATVSATGLLQRVLPLTAALFATAVIGTLVAWRRSAALRAWTQGLDLRVPILLHVIRIGFGALFLAELAAGRLPATFAERGGYGDILAGALALIAALAIGRPPAGRAQPASASGRLWGWAFSVVGLAVILLVFATAQVGALAERDPLIIGAIGRLPYSLLPTLVVPLVVLTHVLVMQRLRAAAREDDLRARR